MLCDKQKHVYSFEFLNYQSSWFSGKDYQHGLWGWAAVIYMASTGDFDWTRFTHVLALLLTAFSFPAGTTYNWWCVTSSKNGPDHSSGYEFAVRNQWISLSIVAIMGLLGVLSALVSNGWCPFDPLTMFVAVTTVDCLSVKLFLFGRTLWQLYGNQFVWPM